MLQSRCVENSGMTKKDDFGGEVVLHVEVGGENVQFGVETGNPKGNIGLTSSSVPAEFEVEGKTVSIEPVAFIDTTSAGGV